MRLILDAKDLIDLVEHEKPVSIHDLRTWLCEKGCALVYSLANIRALVAPIGIDVSHIPRIQNYVEQLEQLPHCYISDFSIDLLELNSALRSVVSDQEYEPIDPYVPRFDFVFPGFADPNRSIYHLWDIVYDLWKTCPQIFVPPVKAREMLTLGILTDRAKAPKGRARLAAPPRDTIVDTLMTKMHATRKQADEIAAWVGASPFRCPGLRMVRAVGVAISQNLTYMSRQDDIFDISQTITIPYVDAITLDRTMCDYVARAENALLRSGSPPNQRKKVFKNLRGLMEALS